MLVEEFGSDYGGDESERQEDEEPDEHEEDVVGHAGGVAGAGA